MKNVLCHSVHTCMWWVLANPVTYLRVKFSCIYGFEHFVLNTFHIIKPQYTISCTRFQGKTFQDYLAICDNVPQP